jgi:hypothetical protein
MEFYKIFGEGNSLGGIVNKTLELLCLEDPTCRLQLSDSYLDWKIVRHVSVNLSDLQIKHFLEIMDVVLEKIVEKFESDMKRGIFANKSEVDGSLTTALKFKEFMTQHLLLNSSKAAEDQNVENHELSGSEEM